MGDVYWNICLVWEATFASPSLHTAVSSCRRLLLNSSRKLMAPFHGLSLASFSKWPWVAGAWLGSWNCALPLPTLPECWWPLGRCRRVAAWGVLAQQVSSQLHCGMKPYSIRSRSSGWQNTKQRSAVRAREWDPKQGDTKLHSCPLPCEKSKCCVTGLSKKNKEIDIFLKGNQNLELAKQ